VRWWSEFGDGGSGSYQCEYRSLLWNEQHKTHVTLALPVGRTSPAALGGRQALDSKARWP
jgi:hypothetical protein